MVKKEWGLLPAVIGVATTAAARRSIPGRAQCADNTHAQPGSVQCGKQTALVTQPVLDLRDRDHPGASSIGDELVGFFNYRTDVARLYLQKR